MAKEAKALFAKCPNCATVTARPVESYRTALKTGGVRSFTCTSCKTDYFVRNEHVSCGVIQEATPQTHPLHITA
jgi:formate dehydrogenase maturation protein FdhE